MNPFAKYKRGDVVWIHNKDMTSKHLQKGDRPVIIIQNDCGNTFSPTLIVASITGKIKKTNMPTHVYIESPALDKPSIVMTEQIKTIDKSDIYNHSGTLTDSQMNEIDKALSISIGLKLVDKRTATQIINELPKENLKTVLSEIDQKLLREIAQELNLVKEKKLKKESVSQATINKSIFGNLKSTNITLQGKTAEYIIQDRVVINLKDGKIAKEHLHILIEELSTVQKIMNTF